MRNRIALSILLFIVSYILFLFLWLHFKGLYGELVTNLGARSAALVTGSVVEKVVFQDEKATVDFIYQALTARGPANLHFDAVLFVSKYSYNLPLTLAIIVALFPLVKWRSRILIESLFLVLVIHFIYVLTYCNLQIYYALVKSGVKGLWKPEQFFWEFSWAFVNAMVIRFEPFLIGIFLWFRSRTKRRRQEEKQKGPFKGALENPSE